MTRKKTSSRQTASAQEFSHSPFKNLKGLSALAEAPRQESTAQPARANEKLPASEPHDQQCFAGEMAFLGVKPLPDRVAGAGDSECAAAEPAAPTPRLSRQEQDQVDFLAAVGGMTTTFHDEWPTEAPARQALPRRVRQVARGQLRPDAELDLHGLSVDEAATKVRFFLQNAIFQGFRVVLVITGKGLHSSDRPVLREAIGKLLGELPEQVVEWAIAPRRYGGEGALVVFLRGPVAG